MEYDQEFEKYWEKCDYGQGFKSIAYDSWKAAKAIKPEKQTIELQGGVFTITTTFLNNKDSGIERKTKSDAKKAAELMQKRDRLAAFVYEHCGYEYEFIECSDDNFFIYYDDEQEIYEYACEDGFPDLCKQYMPEATATWLCEKINSGEIVL